MSWKPEVDEIERRKQFADALGGEEAVRRQHEGGRLTARERIERLVDPGSWFEIGALAGKGEYDKEGRLLRVRPSNAIIGTGRIGGRKVSLDLAHALPAPQPDHYFLNLMLSQWRDAPHKDAPAMLQSDRALALASTQIALYRDEFLVQATWAVTLDRWEDAARLYEAAQKIDPKDREAASGPSHPGSTNRFIRAADRRRQTGRWHG